MSVKLLWDQALLKELSEAMMDASTCGDLSRVAA